MGRVSREPVLTTKITSEKVFKAAHQEEINVSEDFGRRRRPSFPCQAIIVLGFISEGDSSDSGQTRQPNLRNLDPEPFQLHSHFWIIWWIEQPVLAAEHSIQSSNVTSLQRRARHGRPDRSQVLPRLSASLEDSQTFDTRRRV